MQSLLIFMKSTHNLICHVFFITIIGLDNHMVCLTRVMIPKSNIFSNSCLNKGANLGLILLIFYLKGFVFGRTGMVCWMLSPLYALMSSYDHANTFLYSITSFLIFYFSSQVVPVPIIIIFVSVTIPIFIS